MKKVLNLLFLWSVFIITSCNLSSFLEDEKYVDVSTVAASYGDTFTLSRREDKSKDLIYSYCNSANLQKEVIILTKVVDRTLTTISTENYCNYYSVKYSDANLNELKTIVEAVPIANGTYSISSDNRFYLLSSFNSIGNAADFIEYKKHGSVDSSQSGNFVNDELVEIKIKNPSINKTKLLGAIADTFGNSSCRSKLKVIFINDSDAVVNSYEFIFDSVNGCYNFKEVK